VNSSQPTSQAKPHLGSLKVYLETPEVAPGDVVIGAIGLQLNEAIGANSLCIEFVGEIASEFTERSRNSDGTTDETTYREHRYITSYRCPIYEWPNGVQPGQYLLPFELKVPFGLPSSFYFTRFSATARLSYKITCWLIPGIQDTVNLGIYQREAVMYQSLKLRHSANLTHCCFSKGTISYSLELNKGSYFIGEDVELRINLDLTQARRWPTYLQGHIYFRVRLEAQGRSDVFAGKVASSRVAVNQVENVQTLTMLFRLHLEKFEQVATLSTDLIKCNFYAFIEPSQTSFETYSQFSFDLPLIVNSRIAFQPPPVPPSNWNPSHLNRRSIEFSDRNLVPGPSVF